MTNIISMVDLIAHERRDRGMSYIKFYNKYGDVMGALNLLECGDIEEKLWISHAQERNGEKYFLSLNGISFYFTSYKVS